MQFLHHFINRNSQLRRPLRIATFFPCLKNSNGAARKLPERIWINIQFYKLSLQVITRDNYINIIIAYPERTVFYFYQRHTTTTIKLHCTSVFDSRADKHRFRRGSSVSSSNNPNEYTTGMTPYWTSTI